MRIITGSAHGMKLYAPRKTKMRPTADRVREALFNMLGGAVSGAMVMDLFAGAGGIGIEALSRGARRCLFADNHHDCVDCIRRNLAKAKLEENAEVHRLDAWQIHNRIPPTTEAADIIYIDPPYRQSRRVGPSSRIYRLLVGLSEASLLAENGIVIIEHDDRANPPEEMSVFELADRREYGKTLLSFYEVAPGTQEAGP